MRLEHPFNLRKCSFGTRADPKADQLQRSRSRQSDGFITSCGSGNTMHDNFSCMVFRRSIVRYLAITAEG
jgi:hypothetical protein